MKYWLFLLFSAVFMLQPLLATVSKEFADAAALYDAGKYEDASEAFALIVENHPESAVAAYNLGLSRFKSGKLGPAILYLERAKRLDPLRTEIANSLEIATKQVETQPMPAMQNIFVKTILSVIKHTSSSTFGRLAVLFSWLGATGLFIYFRGNRRKKRKVGFYFFVGAMTIMSIMAFLSRHRYLQDFESIRGVVMATSTSLQSSPDPGSMAIEALSEGLSFHIIEKVGDWYHIELSNGDQGWVSGQDIAKV
jgi:tetratricopeptide (TPR) repeat protein